MRGFPAGKLGRVRFFGTARDAGLVFWTIKVWEQEVEMRFFRKNGAHQKAMPKLAEWCDEGTYVHWGQAGEESPAPAEAAERLIPEGVVSRVKHLSPNHANRRISMPVKKTFRF